MRRTWLFLVMAVFFSGLPAHAQLVGSGLRPTLLVKHTDTGLGEEVTAKVGGLGFSSTEGFGLAGASTLREGIPGRWPVPRMPSLSIAGTPTQEAVLNLARSWIDSNIAQFGNALQAYMEQYGLSSAWYLYQKNVTVQGPGRPLNMRLTWTLFQDGRSRRSYGAPRLEPLSSGDVIVLYVQYVQKAMPADIPNLQPLDWGGFVRWQLLSGDLVPLTGVTPVDVNGAFDTPLGEDSNNYSPLSCLISRYNPGCFDAGIDVQRLLAQNGAMLALVDYTYPPEAELAAVNDGFCPEGSPSDGCFAAVGTYYYDERKVEYIDCGAKARYYNRGYYAINAEVMIDRYVVDPRTLDANLIQRLSGAVPTSPAPFEWTLDVPESLVALLADPQSPLVIHPETGGEIIDARTFAGNIVLREITTSASSTDDTPSKPKLYHNQNQWSTASSKIVEVFWDYDGCVRPDRYELYAGYWGSSAWSLLYSGPGLFYSFNTGSVELSLRLRACKGEKCGPYATDFVIVCAPVCY